MSGLVTTFPSFNAYIYDLCVCTLHYINNKTFLKFTLLTFFKKALFSRRASLIGWRSLCMLTFRVYLRHDIASVFRRARSLAAGRLKVSLSALIGQSVLSPKFKRICKWRFFPETHKPLCCRLNASAAFAKATRTCS